jgi:hypothetical protein
MKGIVGRFSHYRKNLLKNRAKIGLFALYYIISFVLIFILLTYLSPNIIALFSKSPETSSITLSGNDLLYNTQSVGIDAAGNRITTTLDDNAIVYDVNEYKNIQSIKLDIAGLNRLQAQVFWVSDNEQFTESKSIWFTCQDGANIIEIPNNNVRYIRLDFTNQANISFIFDSITFSMFDSFPIILFLSILLAGVVSILFVDILINKRKLLKSIYNNFMYSIDIKAIKSEKGMFKQSNIFTACIIITAIACYFFTLANPSMSIDDEFYPPDIYGRYNSFSGIAQGRWSGWLINKLITIFEFLPVFSGLFIVVGILLSCYIWANLFDRITNHRISDISKTVFCCGLISFSYTANIFIFMQSSAQYLVAFPIAAFLAWLFNEMISKRIKWLGGSLLFVFVGTLANDYGYPFYAISIFIIILLYIYYDDSDCYSYKMIFFNLFRYIGLLIASVIAFEIIGKLLRFIFNVQKSNYLDGFILYRIKDGLSNFRRILDFKEIFLYDTTGHIIFLLSLLLIIFSILLSIHRRSFKIFIISFMLILSPYALSFLTGNFQFPYRSRTNISLFFGFSLMFIFMQFERVGIKYLKVKLPLKWVCLPLLAFLILAQCRMMNEIFYVDYLRYQFDLSTGKEIIHDIGEKNPENKPVVLLGRFDFVSPLTTQYEVAGHSYFYWERNYSADYELYSGRIVNFFIRHGYEIKINRLTKKEEFERALDAFNAMPAYPVDGYIRDCGDYLLIKLGNETLLGSKIQ